MNPKHSSFVLIAGAIAGLLFPQFAVLKPYVIPMLGGLIFFSSLDITLKCLKIAMKKPKIHIAHFAVSFLIIPATAGLIGTFLISDPNLLAGYILVCASPPAIATSVWSKLAKGDQSMGMAFVIFSLLATPIMMPFWIFVFLHEHIALNLLDVARLLSFVIFIPLAAAFILRKSKPLKTIGQPAIMALIFLIFSTVIAGNTSAIFSSLAPLLLVLALLCVGIGYSSSHTISKFFSPAERIPFELAATIKNMGLALSIALVYFGETATLPGIFLLLTHAVILSLVFLQFDKHK